MKVINKKEINSQDWKNFISWVDEDKFLFNNKNFFGELFSINKEFLIEESLIEFFLYNYFILENRYSLNWPNWLKEIKGKDLDSYIENLFKKFIKDEDIFNIYWMIVEYKRMKYKDVEREFELTIEYNKLIKKIRDLKTKNYNELIIYINNYIHKDLKGIK